MGDYVRWAPPYYGSDERPGARHPLGALPGPQPRQALDPARPEVGRRPRGPAAARRATTTSSWRASAPASSTGSAAATRRCARSTRGIVYCAITGYGQTGPNTARAGHDMNYLGLNGLLGLTGEPGGRPIQSAGPDRRPRRRGADGGVRGHGRAARARALGRGPARRRLDDRRRRSPGSRWSPPSTCATARSRSGAQGSLTGGFVCYLPYEAADGWVTCGALEPKFWRALLRGRRATRS